MFSRYSAEMGTTGTDEIERTIMARSSPVEMFKDVIRPTGVTVNALGEVVVTEEGRHCVSIFRPAAAVPFSFGSSYLKKPCGVATKDDKIFVVDCEHHCVFMFNTNGHFINSVGKLGSGNLEFNEPMGIAIHPKTNKIYVTEFKNSRIQVLDCDLKSSILFGKNTTFTQPWGVAFDSEGHVYVTDAGTHCVLVFEEDGTYMRKFGCKGEDVGQLSWPSSIAIDNKDLVYVTEDDNHRVSIFTHMGRFKKSFGKKGTSTQEFHLPHGIAIDTNGLNVYISDHYNNRLLKY